MKKVRYDEPKMPESLRKLMDLDAEDGIRDPKATARRGTKKVSKARSKSQVKQGKQKKINDRSQERKTKKVKIDSKLQPKKISSKRTNKPVRPESNARYVDKRAKGKIGASTASGIGVKKEKKVEKSLVGRTGNKKQRKKKLTFRGLALTVVYGISVLINFLIHGGEKELSISKEKKKILDKNFNRFFSAIFMGFMVILLILNLFHRDAKESVEENRALEQKPVFSISDIVSGKYSSKFSDYVSDQFSMRSGFIKSKARFDLISGKDKINGVYIGKEGYLMEGFKMADDESTKSKTDVINDFAAKNTNINVSVLLAPNKVEIYKNYLPRFAPEDSQVEYINKLKGQLSPKIKFVDVMNSFNRLKNNEQLYFKTDHHWTVDGAYAAYEDFCRTLNLQPVNKNSLDKSLGSDKFYGSLYYKNAAGIGKPDELDVYLQKESSIKVIAKYYDTKKKVASVYDVEKLDTKDPYQVFTGGNHTQIKIRTNVDTDRKLLVVKDSYANAMIPFLINNFSEINVVDMRYYSGSISSVLKNSKPTDVLILGNVNTFNTDASILSLNE